MRYDLLPNMQLSYLNRVTIPALMDWTLRGQFHERHEYSSKSSTIISVFSSPIQRWLHCVVERRWQVASDHLPNFSNKKEERNIVFFFINRLLVIVSFDREILLYYAVSIFGKIFALLDWTKFICHHPPLHFVVWNSSAKMTNFSSQFSLKYFSFR